MASSQRESLLSRRFSLGLVEWWRCYSTKVTLLISFRVVIPSESWQAAFRAG